MKLVVDMNLSPAWTAALQALGHDAVDWSEIGDARASDAEIVAWARQQNRVVFTHDLDFTTILALTRASGPSVVQLRTQDSLPSAIGPLFGRVLQSHDAALAAGAVLSIDEAHGRIRIVPLR